MGSLLGLTKTETNQDLQLGGTVPKMFCYFPFLTAVNNDKKNSRPTKASCQKIFLLGILQPGLTET